MRAVYTADLTGILNAGITPETAADFGKWVSEQIVTGTNVRASADYRKKMIAVLTKRNMLDLAKQEKTPDAAGQSAGDPDTVQENEKGGQN